MSEITSDRYPAARQAEFQMRINSIPGNFSPCLRSYIQELMNYPERLFLRNVNAHLSATFSPGGIGRGRASESSVALLMPRGKSQHGLQQQANRKPSTETVIRSRSLTDVPSLEKSSADLADLGIVFCSEFRADQ